MCSSTPGKSDFITQPQTQPKISRGEFHVSTKTSVTFGISTVILLLLQALWTSRLCSGTLLCGSENRFLKLWYAKCNAFTVWGLKNRSGSCMLLGHTCFWWQEVQLEYGSLDTGPVAQFASTGMMVSFNHQMRKRVSWKGVLRISFGFSQNQLHMQLRLFLRKHITGDLLLVNHSQHFPSSFYLQNVRYMPCGSQPNLV